MVGVLSQGTTIRNFLKNSPVLSFEIADVCRISEDNLIEKLKLSRRELSCLNYELYVLSENLFLKNRFATILKAQTLSDLPSRRKNFFIICLNKNKIFDEKYPFLKELLIYILTHELVHMVRFIRYESNFCLLENELEEKMVHKITKELLKDFYFLPYMQDILAYFDGIYLKGGE